MALLAACQRPTPAPPVDAAFEAPPVRPTAVVGRAHLGRPRATLEALNTALGSRRPTDLLLAVGLGVDVAVLSAVDLARPVEVALLSAPMGSFALALTPGGAGHARSLLSPRYRFVVEADLGERLVPRGDPGLSATDGRLPCALVRVPARIPLRVVCASDETTLRAAGRWIAFEAAAHFDDRHDFEVVFDGVGLARDLAPALRDAAGSAHRQLLASVQAARRAHGRPPDLGDPEVAVALLTEGLRSLADDLAALRSLTLRGDVGPHGVDLAVRAHFPASVGGWIAEDARARLELTGANPLLGMLPADAFLTVGSRTSRSMRRATLTALTHAALRVLGDRVSEPDAARRDLDVLFASAGESLAFSVTPDSQRGWAFVLAMSQTDRGAAARAALTRMLSASWLRGIRLGGTVQVSPLRDGVLVTGTRPDTDALAVGVRHGALLVVLGRNPRVTLEALGAPGDPLAEEGLESAQVELRFRPFDPPLRVTWHAVPSHEGAVEAIARIRLPPPALSALALLAE